MNYLLIILLGLILLVLIGILLTLYASFSDLQRQAELINVHVSESNQSLQLLGDSITDLKENMERILHISTDIEEIIDKYEIEKAVKILDSIEFSLSDLKLLHDTMSSVERSLDIIVAHPAFTNHDDDPPH
jgi:hypothetical protein